MSAERIEEIREWKKANSKDSRMPVGVFIYAALDNIDFLLAEIDRLKSFAEDEYRRGRNEVRGELINELEFRGLIKNIR